MTTNDIAKMGDGGRQGCYDVDVEIFRRGELLTGFLSHVRPGDCFQKIVDGTPSGRWFKCLTPIEKSSWPSNPNNPTFSMAGIEVMQAAPGIEQPAAKPVPRLDAPDVDDVDFQDLD